MSITVILADDHKIVRDGLRNLLQKYPEIEVIGEAEDGRSTVEMARELSPDVVIMDIAMPDMNGIEATRRIVEEKSGVKVVALSMHSDKRFVSEMLKAGASAYLLKHSAFEELMTAVMTVMEGRMYLSPAVTGVVVDHYIKQNSNTESSVFSVLSDREREVLQLLAEGKNTKEIASSLNLSSKTVDAHRMNIMLKLNMHSIAELTKYAIREGLTSL
jgi:DNA-binding NarL/FixJ family response regulator